MRHDNRLEFRRRDENIVGQPLILSILDDFLDNGRMPHDAKLGVEIRRIGRGFIIFVFRSNTIPNATHIDARQYGYRSIKNSSRAHADTQLA
ncbi:hypothetical protein HMPREF2939_18610 [Achromobacter xylosoxidans]|nr:hypothetical protein HMPREF2939_18610 [Achromobacter xylosoxidans]